MPSSCNLGPRIDEKGGLSRTSLAMEGAKGLPAIHTSGKSDAGLSYPILRCSRVGQTC